MKVKMKTCIIDEVDINPLVTVNSVVYLSVLRSIKNGVKINISRPINHR